VGDAVEALVRIARNPRLAGEIVNIGSDKEISIKELAMTVRQRTNSRSEIEYVPYSEAYGPGFEDMYRRVPSLDKLYRLTAFKPDTGLTDIIDSIIAHSSAPAAAITRDLRVIADAVAV
jgi:UDP-glucose 4-epimerase